MREPKRAAMGRGRFPSFVFVIICHLMSVFSLKSHSFRLCVLCSGLVRFEGVRVGARFCVVALVMRLSEVSTPLCFFFSLMYISSSGKSPPIFYSNNNFEAASAAVVRDGARLLQVGMNEQTRGCLSVSFSTQRSAAQTCQAACLWPHPSCREFSCS